MNIGMGLGLPFRSSSVAADLAAAIRALFLGGEQGVWYDPSEISQYTTRGTELIVNGGFDSGSDWIPGAGWVISGGVATATATTVNIRQVLSSSAAGRLYLVEFDVVLTAGNLRAEIGAGIGATVTSSGRYRSVITTTSADLNLFIYAPSSAFSGTIDNVTVKQITVTGTPTMFQDAEGTAPVTGVGQSVGLMLDKSLDLTRGAEVVTDGGFDTGAPWTTTIGSVTITGGAAVWAVTPTGNGIFQTATIAAGAVYEIVYQITAITSGALSVRLGNSGVAGNTPTRTQPGTYTEYLRAAAGVTQFVQILNTGVTNASVELISVKQVAGNHAVQATTALKPTLQQDTNNKYYLAFDGVDDNMATAAVNFTATDKMSIFAGVRKLSDAARGMVAELSVSTTANNGTFALTAPNAASATYAFESKGTLLTDAVATGLPAPLTSVLSGISDIAGDSNVIRVNSVQVDSDVGDQGTGNFGTYPIYIGRRAGTSLPFNGRIYSLVIRGASTNGDQLAAAETYVNSKTGAY